MRPMTRRRRPFRRAARTGPLLPKRSDYPRDRPERTVVPIYPTTSVLRFSGARVLPCVNRGLQVGRRKRGRVRTRLIGDSQIRESLPRLNVENLFLTFAASPNELRVLLVKGVFIAGVMDSVSASETPTDRGRMVGAPQSELITRATSRTNHQVARYPSAASGQSSTWFALRNPMSCRLRLARPFCEAPSSPRRSQSPHG